MMVVRAGQMGGVGPVIAASGGPVLRIGGVVRMAMAEKGMTLPTETIETLKTERPNLKGLYSILANEKLGKDILKQLVSYGDSSKFSKAIENEAKAKEKAEKERVREKKKARKERD